MFQAIQTGTFVTPLLGFLHALPSLSGSGQRTEVLGAGWIPLFRLLHLPQRFGYQPLCVELVCWSFDSISDVVQRSDWKRFVDNLSMGYF
jgi:hypothetical protein